MKEKSATQIFVIAQVNGKLRVLTNKFTDGWLDVEDESMIPYGSFDDIKFHSSAYDKDGNSFLWYVIQWRNEMLGELK